MEFIDKNGESFIVFGDKDTGKYEVPIVKKIHQRFQIIKELGKGSFGTVNLVKNLTNGVNFAMKVIDFRRFVNYNDKTKEYSSSGVKSVIGIIKEGQLLRSLKVERGIENIPTFYDIFIYDTIELKLNPPIPGPDATEVEKNMYEMMTKLKRKRVIEKRAYLRALNSMKEGDTPPVKPNHPKSYYMAMIMEYIEGQSLEDIISDFSTLQRRFSMRAVLKTARKLAVSLHEMHNNGFVHRDIKDANIMMKNYEPYFIDFGFACYDGKSDTKNSSSSSSSIVPTRSRSPERTSSSSSSSRNETKSPVRSKSPVRTTKSIDTLITNFNEFKCEGAPGSPMFMDFNYYYKSGKTFMLTDTDFILNDNFCLGITLSLMYYINNPLNQYFDMKKRKGEIVIDRTVKDSLVKIYQNMKKNDIILVMASAFAKRRNNVANLKFLNEEIDPDTQVEIIMEEQVYNLADKIIIGLTHKDISRRMSLPDIIEKIDEFLLEKGLDTEIHPERGEIFSMI